MKLIDKLERLERMDKLIALKATGTPKEFAKKICVSESTLYELLKVVKELGGEIHYCRTTQSYTYISPVRLSLGYVKEA